MALLTDTAEAVLKKRYYLKNDEGECIEDWDALCWRVATAVGGIGGTYTDRFHDMIYNLDFLPNSPCLMNAGTDIGQLSACFVLPVEDSMDGIFTSIKNGALIHKSGGGTGYSFNRLRAKNSNVKSTQGVASGPLSFAKVFDAATETIKQGGKRRGANMAILNIDHPDIEEFIRAKEVEGEFSNFNFSVAITNKFMEAPDDELFDLICEKAHSNGEPGVIFIDRINAGNQTPQLGNFESVNPCGEQPLLPYESCNLGSINLSNFVFDGRVDYTALCSVVRWAVRFLDNVIDVNKYPIPEIEKATKETRKIGLGIMGLHDMLIQLGIPYDSDEGRLLASTVMEYIYDIALEMSEELSEEKGAFPAYDPDINGYSPRRNACVTTIAPTGTLSMIADCSSGCEPYYALEVDKHVLDGQVLKLRNKFYDQALKDGMYEHMRDVFRTAPEVHWKDHIEMQAALQPYVDAAISKTINMPNTATVDDVKKAYIMAWEMGCKGLTIYRDGSRNEQVIYKSDVYSSNPPETAKEYDDAWGAFMVKPKQVDMNGKAQLPGTLAATRFKLRDGNDDEIYIIICFNEDNEPMEVFAKFPYDNRADQASKSTLWTTVCRIISLSLRYSVPVDEIIKQLDKSSGVMTDLPAQLGRLLKTFMSSTDSGFSVGTCPEEDCGAELIYTEGCSKCPVCGFSKCD